MKKTIVFLVSVFCYLSIYAQEVDSLTIQLQEIASTSKIPGFAVGVVSDNGLLYKKGFGYANLKNKVPYTDETIHNVGSTTKTLIGFSLMKLVEEGKVALEDPINRYLPCKIFNPHFPKDIITIRQLATHTSSLTDGKDDMVIEKSYLFRGNIDFSKDQLPEDYYEYFQIYKKNQSMSMIEFLKNTYCTDGEWYETSNFLEEKPGTIYNYTNIGATLLAYIIEQITKEEFSEYTKKNVFNPLKMKSSYWSIDDVPKSKLASLYMSNGLEIPHYDLITYPDGGLYTNVSDFCQYLIEMIKGISGQSKLLSHESYKEMMSDQLTDENFPNNKFETSKGLMWSVNAEGDNITANGADPGIVTYTLFTTQGNVGMVIFMNTSVFDIDELEKDFIKIRATIFQNVGKLLKQYKPKD